MNKVDAVVTEVTGEPEYKYGKWFVPVKANSYGRIAEKELMFDTKEEAKSITKGYEFLT